MDRSVPGLVALADWRRQVAQLYAGVRAEADPEQGWRRWCDGRHDLFVNHPQSPIPAAERAEFRGPFTDPYDPTARTVADLEASSPELIEIGNSDGATTRFTRFARATFELYGRSATLEVFWLEAYGGGIYLSFRDATSGDTTYGGGRYLLDTVKGADLGTDGERLILDFNFAYQPSCSYDPSWSCPLPPPANRLPFAVPVGEQLSP